MDRILFYTYPSCTSCRKAKQWLKSNNILFEERHIFRDTPSYEELLKILQLTTEGIDEILATRSQTFKKLNKDINELTVSEVVKLIIDDPRLLRRPILTDGTRLLVGYNESGLRNLTGKRHVIRAS
ncbi:Spx/MgsR family RNA polymerase-binding regulatory protein [Bacillus sp. HMF5848]|uniref:Spx/MgsR family RNA polymerase-binding regulatory protein n=1 Tax=Bacillus sp. HMF5848 TaxID=2495421 RepID=UPI000F799A28|nr:Spx/MgsR family RNA polymerase-binding regulatory protein [Bacillus sp. HMF5848]RSK27832.1 Spx/MgsR family RNA polymerase-binding regulatory protein [Bacillus sp. HMF5848]